MTTSSDEAARRAHWDRLEATIAQADLLTDVMREFLQVMRSLVRVHGPFRGPAPGLPSKIETPETEIPRLVEAARRLSVPEIIRLEVTMRRTPFGPLFAALRNQVVLASDVDETRRLFGLADPPSREFHAAAGAAALAITPGIGPLLSEWCSRAPSALGAATGHEDLARACMSNDAALGFIDAMARRIEETALEMFEKLRPRLYVPSATPQEGEFPEDVEARELREFLHWLSLVVHRLHVAGALVVQEDSMWCTARYPALLLEHSLFDAAAITFLRQRFPESFQEIRQDEDASKEEWIAQLHQQYERQRKIVNFLEVLSGQWEHLPAEKRRWSRGELQLTRKHVRSLQAVVGNVARWLVYAVQMSPEQRSSRHREIAPLGARPNARHTLIAISDELERARVHDHFRKPCLTNCAASSVSVGNRDRRIWLHMARHHAEGRPCLGVESLIPMAEIFPSDSQFVRVADYFAREGDALWCDWRTAREDCELTPHTAKLISRIDDAIHLISYYDADSEEAGVAFFVLPERETFGWLEPGEAGLISAEGRNDIQQFGITLPKEPLVALPWILPEESEYGGEEE